jgi:hypothetical protein
MASGCSSCVVTSPSHPVVKSYLEAEIIAPAWNPCIYESQPMWNHAVPVGPGLSVTLTARCCIGGRFEALYSDEAEPRTVGRPGDYVYPLELRVDPRRMRAFGRASGLAGGIFQKTVIFEYDLQQRRAVSEIEVDPVLLPAPPEPAGSKPRDLSMCPTGR